VTQHIPDTGEHLIRYYGFYSNKESRVGGKSRDGDESWDEMAPPQVAEIIRQRGSSDYKKRVTYISFLFLVPHSTGRLSFGSP